MKKITTISLIALLSISAYADAINGTLSVDSGNKLTNVPKADMSNNSDKLSVSGLTPNSEAKDVETASTLPSYPSGSSSSYLEGPFVGLELGALFSSDADGASNSGLSYGIRFGAQNVEWRTMAVIEKFGSGEEYNNFLKGILQVDYYFLGSDALMIDTYGFRPYAGINAGAMSLDTESDSINSLVYGAQVGATMNVMQNIDLDVGLRYDLSSSSRIDHTSELVVGLHYKY